MERIEEILETPLSEANQEVYRNYYLGQAKEKVDDAERQSGALVRATENANTAVLIAHAKPLTMLPTGEARRLAADLVASRRAYQGATDGTEVGAVRRRDLDEVEGGVRSFVTDPIGAACAHLTSQRLGYIAGERPKTEGEDGLRIDTTFAITPTEGTQRLVEDRVGFSLVGGVDEGLSLVRFKYGDQDLVEAGGVTEAYRAAYERQFGSRRVLAPGLSDEVEARVGADLAALPPDLAAGFRADLTQIPEGARADMENAIEWIKAAAERQRFHDRCQTVARNLGAVEPYQMIFAGREVEVPERYRGRVEQGWLRYIVTEEFDGTFLPGRGLYMESRLAMLDFEAVTPDFAKVDEEMVRAQAVVIPFWEIFRNHNGQVSINGRLIDGYEKKLNMLLRHEVPEEGIVVAQVGMREETVMCESLLEQTFVLSKTGIPVVPGLRPDSVETREEGRHRITEVVFRGDRLPEIRGLGRYWLKLTCTVDKEDGSFMIDERVGVDRTVEA